MSIPTKVQRLKDETNELLAYLIGSAIVDDQNFAVAKQVDQNKWEVTFDNAEHVSLAFKYNEYDTLYNELFQKRCFTAKLIDGGLVQIQYLFVDDILVKHRLLFLPSPSLQPFNEADEDYIQDKLYSDIVSRKIVPFPLRFDYDQSAAKDIEHPACHLTLGDAINCRIPVTSPLSPKKFIDFIVRNFYNTNDYDFTDALPDFSISFDSTITDNEKNLIHVFVP